MSSIPEVDLVVVGAGWHGLSVAKTYLEVHPNARLVIYEAASTIGGVWAKERLYPELRTNNLIGMYEFSDFPMDPKLYGVKSGDHIPGDVVHQYLEDFAKHFGIFKCIKFATRVESAERQEIGGWLLHMSGLDWEIHSKIIASHLVMATGLTSDPALPSFPGRGSFEPPLFHNIEMPNHTTLLDKATQVTIYGGTKSSWDMVYLFASKGIKVDWIIKKSGHGPGWLAPVYVTPIKAQLEKLLLTRFLTWFSPCIWGDADGFSIIRWFLHRTWLGNLLVAGFWAILKSDLEGLIKYDSHTETSKLKPWSDLSRVGAGLSILNYKMDIFELIRKGIVQVHVADIETLDHNEIRLSTGSVLVTDALISCTGWKHASSVKFIPTGIDLGIPGSPDSLQLHEMTKHADQEIFACFPRLNQQTKLESTSTSHKEADVAHEISAYRLYRFMVPPGGPRDIAFAGCMMTTATPVCADLQALWITAYFDDKIVIPTDVVYQTILHNRFGKWRSSAGFGNRFPDVAFDGLPFFDLLLSDLGLQSHRKKGIISEVFSNYSAEDYRGVVQEWMAKQAAE
ncbi:hypothetical protein EG329_005414 [Mollisiaceae sp. DMI_Dod_QoI]|nr:hypothetical protein EG329_005414 [Helotiales sp. DMI_Dod_QoI]